MKHRVPRYVGPAPADVDEVSEALANWCDCKGFSRQTKRMDRETTERVARYLKQRYSLRQSIPELIMGLDNAFEAAAAETR